jgi:hypothetical protein
VGKLSLLQGGNYNFLMQNAQLAGLPPDAQYNPVGPGYSTVVATSLDLSGLSLSNPFDINLESLSAPLGQAADRFYFYLPYTFTLVSTTDGITGAFNAADFDVITMPNNGTTGFDNSNGGEWTVAESSNGDNLLLEYTPTEAPEPSTWVMMLGGLGLLGFCVRRARPRLNPKSANPPKGHPTGIVPPSRGYVKVNATGSIETSSFVSRMTDFGLGHQAQLAQNRLLEQKPQDSPSLFFLARGLALPP